MSGRRGAGEPRIATVFLATLAAAAVVAFARPQADLLRPAFAAVVARPVRPPVPGAAPSMTAYGVSGAVRMRFVLPGSTVAYPLEVHGDPSTLAYQWVRARDGVAVDGAQPLADTTLRAPSAPGLYRLALVRDSARRELEGLTVAVMVPFSQKVGSLLDGYRIGTYLAEKLGTARSAPPEGFVRVEDEAAAETPISAHFRLADFVNHDEGQGWPRYAAVSPKLLDKLELVMAEIARQHGDTSSLEVAVDVHSGFRAPSHNRSVRRAARDSRHQYGDAADVTIDANFDGKYTVADTRLVAAAVERVEAAHPELIGGMGIYTSRRYPVPYVHIDARGDRARWHG